MGCDLSLSVARVRCATQTNMRRLRQALILQVDARRPASACEARPVAKGCRLQASSISNAVFGLRQDPDLAMGVQAAGQGVSLNAGRGRCCRPIRS